MLGAKPNLPEKQGKQHDSSTSAGWCCQKTIQVSLCEILMHVIPNVIHTF
jgi:hypothetical protein